MKPSRSLYFSVLSIITLAVILSFLMALITVLVGNHHNNYRLVPILLLVLLFALLLSTALVSLFYRGIRRTITELTNACTQITQGNYNIQFTPVRYEEVNRLLFQFRQMADLVKQSTLDLEQKKSWLKAILDSLSEGLLVLAPDGRILISNASFRKIINNGDVEGKFYWQVIRNQQLTSILPELNPANPVLTTNIIHGTKTFLLNATYSAAGERVITFSDITEIVRASEMKRDFVLNVSHELRTPLTAIKGYLETMEDAADKNSQRYLEVLRRHTDRLINIVNDLLTISRLETPAAVPELTELEIMPIINEVANIFRSTIKQKGIKLNLNLPPDIPRVKGDRIYLEQALINLLDNAVKYTQQGEITVAVEVKDHKLLLSVQDTGIGIDREHLPRIFERFYVVDRARSRQMGGTGLGLAIVKHIVAVHHGEINVESTHGLGSKFTIILPIANE